MGKRFSEPDEWNSAGYFQDEDFEDWLDVYDFWWDRSKPIIGCRMSDEDALAGLSQLIDARNAEFDVWGVKSQRLAHILPMLAAKTDLKVIRTSRVKAASIASWRAMTGNTLAESTRVVNYINDLINTKLAETNVIPALTVNFSDLMNTPAPIIEQIAAVAGVNVTQPAVGWVQPNLVRFQNG